MDAGNARQRKLVRTVSLSYGAGRLLALCASAIALGEFTAGFKPDVITKPRSKD